MKKWVFDLNGHCKSGVKGVETYLGKEREEKENPKRISLFGKKLSMRYCRSLVKDELQESRGHPYSSVPSSGIIRII